MGSNILPYQKIVNSAAMALNLYIFTDTITHINGGNYGKRISETIHRLAHHWM